jgi:hypothetical protein
MDGMYCQGLLSCQMMFRQLQPSAGVCCDSLHWCTLCLLLAGCMMTLLMLCAMGASTRLCIALNCVVSRVIEQHLHVNSKCSPILIFSTHNELPTSSCWLTLQVFGSKATVWAHSAVYKRTRGGMQEVWEPACSAAPHGGLQQVCHAV